jgi:hypothetical protein
MASSDAATVQEYLDALPDERRAALGAVREVILANLPDGYVETMNWGMISYEIPLTRYPDTYNEQPLGYAGLASQKRYMSLYLMGVYADPEAREWFERAYAERGKKLDMGKSCLRFKRLDDLPLDVIGTLVARTPVDEFLRLYEASRNG